MNNFQMSKGDFVMHLTAKVDPIISSTVTFSSQTQLSHREVDEIFYPSQSKHIIWLGDGTN